MFGDGAAWSRSNKPGVGIGIRVGQAASIPTLGLKARLRTPEFCLSGQGSIISKLLTGADPGRGSPCLSKWRLWESCGPQKSAAALQVLSGAALDGEPKKGQRHFTWKVVAKKVNKNCPRHWWPPSDTTIWVMPPLSPWNNAALGQAAPCL